MIAAAAGSNFTAPHVDYAGISPLIALSAGLCVALLAGLLRTPRWVMPTVTLAVLAATAGLSIWQFGERTDLVASALRLDELGLIAGLIACFAGGVATILAVREPAAEQAEQGAFGALLLGSILGMFILAMAQNLVVFFVGLELLSVPLYVMCGSALRRTESLESGLKYLIVGSLGSATILYGFALLYGGSGSMDFAEIQKSLAGGQADDTLVLLSTAMIAVGLAFKLSMAPFHQWTPDVYQGAPTPVTAFMAVATKAAAFVALVRIFEVALGPVADDWKPALAAIAVISIAVGNVGAIGQDSVKRLLGYSGIAQAGYMLVGVVVFSETGVNALVFYLAAYTLMNLAAFVAITVRERETEHGDDIKALEGIGQSRPLLAWPLTIGVLALAGVPGTSGFVGKLFLIEAAVKGDYTWLGVAIVIGTMVSMAYYLRVLAAVWMKPSPDGETSGAPAFKLVAGVGVICAAATIVFGVAPQPLIDFAQHAGGSIAASLT